MAQPPLAAQSLRVSARSICATRRFRRYRPRCSASGPDGAVNGSSTDITRWLLLRGLSREQRHWCSFPEDLERATGARTLCLDLPGFGTEHARISPRTIALITDDVR